MKLTFFQQEYEVTSVDELRQLLQLRHQRQYAAFWLSVDKGPSISLCINGSDGWLYFFRFDGDSGAYSLNADESTSDETVGFLIDNYQLDQMSRSQVVPKRCGEQALEEFLATQKLPQSVNWQFVD